ncbi:MAG: hypothetical protein JSV36_04145 [Anaerolineae bacterium]|nr:MAG: hypothetical protein JSV36_04145 [Anaerolineae bacterium]
MRSNDALVGLIAFAGNGTHHPDAFVLLNLAEESKRLEIQVLGACGECFQAYRSSEGERYVPLGEFRVRSHVVACDAPPRSATTFLAS